MKKVLIVSFLFPPNNAIGAVRIGKFVKYLPEFGWQPLVLTANENGFSNTLPVESKGSNIIRTKYFTIYDWLTGKSKKINTGGSSSKSKHEIKNNFNLGKAVKTIVNVGKSIDQLPVIERLIYEPVGWYYPACNAGLKALNDDKIDVIFSSFNPSVSHLVASKLQKFARIPWVAEFRDPWSFNAYSKRTQPFHYFDVQWEKRVLKNCDSLVTVSPAWSAELEKLHSKKVTVIPNGFDEEDYQELTPPSAKFTISYTGNIYPGKRDPFPLFQAVKELKFENKITPDDLEIGFFGQNIIEYISPLVKTFDIADFATTSGEIAFKESIQKQKEATILLLLSWNDPRDAGTLPAKIFEYLGAKRPVLALAYPEGEIGRLLQTTGCGVVANQVDEIKDILVNWIREFKNSGKIISHYHPVENEIKNYTRRGQAARLAKLLDQITSGSLKNKVNLRSLK